MCALCVCVFVHILAVAVWFGTWCQISSMIFDLLSLILRTDCENAKRNGHIRMRNNFLIVLPLWSLATPPYKPDS